VKRGDRIGAVPSNDPITPDLPLEDREANLRQLADLARGNKLKTVPPPLGDSRWGEGT
jgi:hypothetical protein